LKSIKRKWKRDKQTERKRDSVSNDICILKTKSTAVTQIQSLWKRVRVKKSPYGWMMLEEKSTN
jgi:hypothetical protein